MALQTCKRCRKRRIKCDLQLPSCSSCQLADAECLFFDDSLGHEVPRSYLHALNVKVEELEAEIRSFRSPQPAPVPQLPVHVALDDYSLQPPSQEPANPRYASSDSYLGPGSSAELLDNLLTTLVRRKLSSPHSPLPKFASTFRDGSDEHTLAFPALNLKINPGKLDTQSLQHPQVQRALIEYYAKAVQPSFPLLSPAQLRLLLGYENPLRQSSNDCERLLIHGMLAISSQLVARDLDRDQTIAASLWTEKLFDHINRIYSHSASDAINGRHTVLAQCFLVLLDLIIPGSSRGSTWEIVGSASGNYAALCEETDSFDDDCQRIGFCLFAFESTVACHFHRPSLFCNSAPSRLGAFSPESEFLSPSLHVFRAMYSINQHFTLDPDPSPAAMEALIPATFRIPASARPSEMSLAQAQIYLALHPLFTSPSAGPHSCSPELLNNIAGAASAFIACTSKLNREHRIISIWTTAESVLQAGAVWGAYLILSKQEDPSILPTRSIGAFGSGSLMEPLLQCSSLLASFAERWKPGRHYFQAWEAFVEMLWADTDIQRRASSNYQSQHELLV
ncbi:fungal specific transcription factor [Diplodia corticola]|uniref:Fungal specific transcription factor n=1 Tax=Diplodia corticola TaxID=236234 RepID=A0A1J9RPX8_9PEZI|nr:fungal specific transcription factor [Diplodia corticola]OJD29613.1 fungal specific transcription factor [Diplodia corticola]